MPATVTPELLTTQRLRYFAFCEGIYELLIDHPASVTSWHRTEAHNKSLPGSVPNSLHLDGQACDLVFDPGVTVDRAAVERVATGLGLRCVWESDHLHVELSPLSLP